MNGSTSADLFDLRARELRIHELIAELTEVRKSIREIDALADVSDGFEISNPSVLDLIEPHYWLLHELRIREALLKQGIEWTTLLSDGSAGPRGAVA